MKNSKENILVDPKSKMSVYWWETSIPDSWVKIKGREKFKHYREVLNQGVDVNKIIESQEEIAAEPLFKFKSNRRSVF